LLVLRPSDVVAVPIADFLYTVTPIVGGFEYDYRLFNRSNPVTDAGANAYDVVLSLPTPATVTVGSLPTGWTSISDLSTFVEMFSLNPGTPPTGTDVAPGTSLGVFVLDFASNVGNLPFTVTFTNPTNPSTPTMFNGTTAPVPVPEPRTILLVASGLASMGCIAWRKRRLVRYRRVPEIR